MFRTDADTSVEARVRPERHFHLLSIPANIFHSVSNSTLSALSTRPKLSDTNTHEIDTKSTQLNSSQHTPLPTRHPPTQQTCQELSCLCTNPVAAQIAACADCLIAEGDSAAANQQIIDREWLLSVLSGDRSLAVLLIALSFLVIPFHFPLRARSCFHSIFNPYSTHRIAT